jgi:hypothetical protein
MTSRVEKLVSHSLRTLLADLPNGECLEPSDELASVFRGFERIVPDVLGEIYPGWYRESLDGILPLLVRKTGECETEIFGLCILMSDQTLTPLYLRLQVSANRDEISWLECRLGERNKDGMSRIPYPDLHKMMRLLMRLDGKIDQIDWFYKATFGKKHV